MKNSYLSEETIQKLQQAYVHEIHNMLIYTQISSYLGVNGFKNLASYYLDWAEEERKHSSWVKDFMDSLNILIGNISLESPSLEMDNSSIIGFAQRTLEVENATTLIYDELLQTAMDFDDSAMLAQFANKMLIEQIEETGKANDINDMLINIGDNRPLLQLFDNTFKG